MHHPVVVAQQGWLDVALVLVVASGILNLNTFICRHLKVDNADALVSCFVRCCVVRKNFELYKVSLKLPIETPHWARLLGAKTDTKHEPQSTMGQTARMPSYFRQ